MANPLGGDDDEIYRPLAEINVTPLVDVMLVLLIIFMVTAPLLSAGVKINLPAAASARPLENKAPLEIGVDRDGGLWLGSQRVELDGLADAVKAKMGGDVERLVRIRGDKDAAFGQVVAALDRLSHGGVRAHRDRRLAAVRGQGRDAAMKAQPLAPRWLRPAAICGALALHALIGWLFVVTPASHASPEDAIEVTVAPLAMRPRIAARAPMRRPTLTPPRPSRTPAPSSRRPRPSRRRRPRRAPSPPSPPSLSRRRRARRDA